MYNVFLNSLRTVQRSGPRSGASAWAGLDRGQVLRPTPRCRVHGVRQAAAVNSDCPRVGLDRCRQVQASQIPGLLIPRLFQYSVYNELQTKSYIACGTSLVCGYCYRRIDAPGFAVGRAVNGDAGCQSRHIEPEKSSLFMDFNRYFEISLALSEKQKASVFQVRYHVYCEEFGYEDAKRFANGLETDSFDERSLHCLVTHRAVGSTRRLCPCGRS